MLTDIQEAIVPKLATWNNCYCCTVNYLKRSWGSGSICFFICFHHGIFLQLVYLETGIKISKAFKAFIVFMKRFLTHLKVLQYL